MKKLSNRTCQNPECKKSYPPKVQHQRFCSKECHNDYHNTRIVRWIKEGKAREGV